MIGLLIMTMKRMILFAKYIRIGGGIMKIENSVILRILTHYQIHNIGGIEKTHGITKCKLQCGIPSY